MVKNLLKDGGKTLFVALGGLGDLIMALPALRLLRDSLPNSSITLLSRTGFGEILKHEPGVDCILGVDFGRGREESIRSVLEKLSKEKYDQVIVTDSAKKFHLRLPEMGITPERCFIRCGTDGTFKTLAQEVDFRPGYGDERVVHLSEQHMAFIAALLDKKVIAAVPTLIIGKDGRDALNIIENCKVSPGEFWICHIGLSHFVKRKGFWSRKRKIAHKAWLQEKWIEFLESFLDGCNKVLLTGSNAEFNILESVIKSLSKKNHPYIHNVAGKTEVLTVAALLKNSKGYIGVDTGPMHVAAAVGVPVLALFGATDENICGPRGIAQSYIARAPVDCSPCTRKVRKNCKNNICMQAISPELLRNILQDNELW